VALYLITGIAGFIGSSLAHELVGRGERVRGIDDFSTGKPENIASIRSRIDFIQADLNDASAVASACRGADYVLHQAAIASVPRSVQDPGECNRVNVDGTLNLLVAARDAGVRRVVYASSCALYGDSPALPKREDMLPNPISPYAVSKLAAEYYMGAFYRVYGLETVSLRYFNVFGPRQDASSDYSGVLAIFISRMLRGEQPAIYGDGEQSRDFVYIDNIVSANLLACTAPAAQVAGRAFNAATGRRITVNEIYAVLQKQTGYGSPARRCPERAGDIKHSLADISQIEAAMGYKPAAAFEEGLRRTVDWYRMQAAAATG
jgi:UDP-N-acetylglucosamine/UDP-N-acetyl-alpha-D-glucosaminouronate 4-epimerase